VAHVVAVEGRTWIGGRAGLVAGSTWGSTRCRAGRVFRAALPKNASGKILKRELRREGELERGVDHRPPSPETGSGEQ